MTSKLADYEQKLSNNLELAKMVPFRVKAKGANDKARLAKVLQHETMCKDTVEVLRDNHQQWLDDPSIFWTRPSPVFANSTDPQVQIVGRFLQTNHADA
jgi:hypothetical protein